MVKPKKRKSTNKKALRSPTESFAKKTADEIRSKSAKEIAGDIVKYVGAPSGAAVLAKAHELDAWQLAALGALGIGATTLTVLMQFLAKHSKRLRSVAQGDMTEDQFEAKKATLNGAKASVDTAREFFQSHAPEEIAEPLGRLLNRYLTTDRAPDAFFRGCTELLAEITPEEFSSLKRVAARVHTHTKLRMRVWFSWGEKRGVAPISAKGPIVRFMSPEDSSAVDIHEPFERIPFADRIHQMLARHQLTRPRLGSGEPITTAVEVDGEKIHGGDVEWSDSIEVMGDVAAELDRLLN